MTTIGESFLAPKEIAAALNVSTQTVYRAVSDGRLPVVRFGGRGAIRVPRSVLDAGLRALAVDSDRGGGRTEAGS